MQSAALKPIFVIKPADKCKQQGREWKKKQLNLDRNRCAGEWGGESGINMFGSHSGWMTKVLLMIASESDIWTDFIKNIQTVFGLSLAVMSQSYG